MPRLRQGRAPAPSPTVYKVISLLLQYPDERLLGARDEILAAVAGLPPSRQKESIERFCAYWAAGSPIELAQRYVEVFDLQKRAGLYLTFYGHGDKRQRGMALLRLKKLYRAAGFPLEGRELSDYLPVMLEFAALASPEQGETLLLEHRSAIELVRMSLRDQESPYAHLLDAVCAGLPELSAAERAGVTELVREGPPTEQVGLEPFAPPEVMPSTAPRR